ncbi:hypothetical protein Q4497_00350 [Mesomycoplasma ovipneumoniae]|uniref:Uncharacterized protein n=1 Tax=Mesomycoplasma ovipneumoniae TaxID=29562 RepID=A0AAW6Q7R3_9BACT|nr:hypothetical protein [Mesomycoplasma ovipneumoniae]MDF9627419.1 hypothetical protein [Mesomycoplasma ovipneumoniae]MDO4157470.1 hypothetical protein [Mesomycoplasma ovipneumoniae]MDO4158556.1 hypothetical protein [Mesomycoplasma ovipneumoniae]MDO6821477.1 hypothetical protein [Mesomycoplasma ovipneumoniae]MDO6855842.1 hypothetical protein [Mesomycoplasma ovipneumoniae]
MNTPNSQNLVGNNKIKNNDSKSIKTEDLLIKDEKLNKNNSEVLDMKDEDDKPIKSKTSINKNWINEIMNAKIKNNNKKMIIILIHTEKKAKMCLQKQ